MWQKFRCNFDLQNINNNNNSNSNFLPVLLQGDFLKK